MLSLNADRINTDGPRSACRIPGCEIGATWGGLDRVWSAGKRPLVPITGRNGGRVTPRGGEPAKRTAGAGTRGGMFEFIGGGGRVGSMTIGGRIGAPPTADLRPTAPGGPWWSETITCDIEGGGRIGGGTLGLGGSKGGATKLGGLVFKLDGAEGGV